MTKSSRKHESEMTVSRRSLIGAAAALGTQAITSGSTSRPAGYKAIERVPLGKTGVKISRLGMGASFKEYGPRMLEFAYRMGVNYFDNGDFYCGFNAERYLGKWVNDKGNRNDVFVVTKAPTTDIKKFEERLADALEKMQLDTIDLFLIHGLADPSALLDRNGQWRKLKDRLIKEKKIRFMGYSTHTEIQASTESLNNAVKSGWVDVAMVACHIGMIRANAEFNKALDTCAKAGIGLIAMKSMRGLGNKKKQSPQAIEAFKELGLTPHTAMLVGLWSDGRFASVCSEMPNRKIIVENSEAARAFKNTFDASKWKQFDKGLKLLSRSTCPGCDGSCRNAAGSDTDFCSIARYLAYYEEDGKRNIARQLYQNLPPEKREWQNADLKAASRACVERLDFEEILSRADILLGDSVHGVDQTQNA